MKTVICQSTLAWGLAFIFFSNTLYSQIDDIQFENISIESGLSQSSVLCMCQDSKGFIWFGTYEGLNRYDGNNFKIFKADPENPYSISKNNVESIIEDHLGVIWVATEDGLNRFDRTTERFIHYKNNPNDPNSLSDNYVKIIYEDRSGIIWVGTQAGGLNKFDRDNNRFIRYKNDPRNPKSLSNNKVMSILEDSRGRFWIGTDVGINRLDRKTGECVRYINYSGNPHSISANGVSCVFESQTGVLWLGTWGGGLNRFDPEKDYTIRYQYNPNDPYSLGHNIIRAIYQDHYGNLWIGTEGGGLNRFVNDPDGKGSGHFIRYQTNPNDPNSISGNSVLSIFEDRLGILWLGTNFNGINKYNPAKRKFTIYRNSVNDENSLSKNTVNAVYEDSKGILWIGTSGGGLNRFDRKKNQFTHFINNPSDSSSLSNNVIRCICEDQYNRLWIGTDDGLNRFDPIKKNFTFYKNNPNDTISISHSTVFCLFKDNKGNLWAGTTGGLNRFDYKKNIFIRYFDDKNPINFRSDYIWTIKQDSSEIFWIGTQLGGLIRFDSKNETFFHYKYDDKNAKSISDNKVLSLFEDHAGNFWQGTSNGLNRFDRNTGVFRRFSEKDGLPSGCIQGMLEDDHGNLWISTNHGLSQLNPATLKFKNYFESNGLQSNEFGVNACCKLKSGEMVLGSVNGFSCFHPDSISIDSSRATVVLTNLQIFNRSVPIGEDTDGRTILSHEISECDQINLSYKDNVFSLEFAALHYASPKDNLYAYKMEGFETEWNYTNANRRFVTYTNLSGGQYTFHVKASNNYGVWDEKGTSIRINITPPFWKTIWFYGLLLIMLLSVAYWIYQWRVQARDLAAQRKMDAALAKERNLLRTLIDNIPDYVYVKDIVGRIMVGNKAIVNQLGFTSENELIGKTSFDILSNEEAARLQLDDQSIIESGKGKFDYEGPAIDKNKEVKERWISEIKVPFKDALGKVIGIVGVNRDITQRKRAEEERERLITELQEALADVKMLSGLVPICASCKKIRDDQGYWTQIESYIQDRSSAKFSHSICPDCAKKLYPNYDFTKKI